MTLLGKRGTGRYSVLVGGTIPWTMRREAGVWVARPVGEDRIVATGRTAEACLDALARL